MKSLSLYIHIPFCCKKCIYCDFYSITSDPKNREVYVKALIDSIEIFANRYSHEYYLKTIYIGGGTPNYLEICQLERIIKSIQKYFYFTPNCNISCEINPEFTSDLYTLQKLKNLGINRLSIGIQSLNDNELFFLGRIHHSKTALDCMNYARKIFENLSFDLIMNLPGQTRRTLESNLTKFIEFDPDHISVYSLTCEKGTPMAEMVASGLIELNNDEIDRDHYLFVRYFLQSHGYKHYEISNFSKTGKESRHNLTYWTNGEYLGLGPSAYSRIEGLRCHFNSSVNEFISNHQDFHHCDKLYPFDDIISGLRLAEGIEEKNLSSDLFHKLSSYADKHPGWFHTGEHRISCTTEGWLFLDSILLDLMDE